MVGLYLFNDDEKKKWIAIEESYEHQLARS